MLYMCIPSSVITYVDAYKLGGSGKRNCDVIICCHAIMNFLLGELKSIMTDF